MKMIQNYSEKINKINKDRILMLNIIKEKISNNNSNLSNEVNNFISLLNVDERNTKEYKAIVKAKKLIFDLTDEIINANSIEEIITLRKKINYYINKIKKEMINRNIDKKTFDDLSQKTDNLRKNIAAYIRFIKRENNINQINCLYRNIDTLSSDDFNNFKKILSNELSYNRRVLKQLNNNDVFASNKKVKERTSTSTDSKEANTIDNKTTDSTNSDNKERENIPTYQEQIQKLDNSLQELTTLIDECNLICKETKGNVFDREYTESFLEERINYYNSQYRLATLFDYRGNFFSKGISFFRNIPRYIYNRKIIKNAINDYNTFYHGQDFGDFISYVKKRNSIRTVFSIIFNTSYLSKREAECLDNHNLCKQWIMTFGDSNDYDTRFRLVKIK